MVPDASTFACTDASAADAVTNAVSYASADTFSNPTHSTTHATSNG